MQCKKNKQVQNSYLKKMYSLTLPRSMFLLLFVDFFLCAESQNLIASFKPGSCIKEGDTATFTCKIQDDNSYRGTEWSGTVSIFMCSSFNTVSNNKIFLPHHIATASGVCGDVFAILHDINDTSYTSTLTINETKIDMDEGIVNCFLGHSGDEQKLLVEAIPVSPTLSNVTFEHTGENSTTSTERKFTIYWTEVANNTKRGISHYSIQSNEDCGQCTNIGNVSNATSELSCIGWEPSHELHKVCNLTIIPIGAFCGFSASSPLAVTVHLNYPQAPTIMSLIPIYGIKGKLLTIWISLVTAKQSGNKGDSCNRTVEIQQTKCDRFGECKVEFNFEDSACLKFYTIDLATSYKFKTQAMSVIGDSLLNMYSYKIEYQNPLIEEINLIMNQRKAEIQITSTKRCNIFTSVEIRYGTTCNCSLVDNDLTADIINNKTCENLSFSVSNPRCSCFTLILTVSGEDQPIGIQLNKGVSAYKAPLELLLILFVFIMLLFF